MVVTLMGATKVLIALVTSFMMLLESAELGTDVVKVNCTVACTVLGDCSSLRPCQHRSLQSLAC